MTTTTDLLAQPLSPPAVEAGRGDYWALLKPGVMSLVVFSGAVGLWVAPGTAHLLVSGIAILSIALGSGAGAALNMWYDRDIDAVMQRTKSRPLPAGRVAADDALVIGLFLTVGAVGLMGVSANWLAAGMLAFAIFFYAVIYTMKLKRSTPQNIVIGGAAGAFPPLIGWLAVSPDITAPLPWVLFLIIFLWTPPHFWALALYRNADYTAAGVPMMPVVRGLESTKRQMLAYTLILLPVTLLPVWLMPSSFLYAIGALLLSAKFCHHAWIVLHREGDGPARKMFGYSILYLFALLGLLALDQALLRFHILPPLL